MRHDWVYRVERYLTPSVLGGGEGSWKAIVSDGA